MKQYQVYDYYEEPMLVGEADTLKEAKAICEQFCIETDGECDMEIYQFRDGHWEVC